ncbi:MAG: Glu-tRNA(Gln) amidotransferase subunit GatE [Nitrososphaerales archaeon]|nr:Glu-tRNA(Gln) amidotransferase subunit GatE [Nitrososphaerales archaeon]
MDFPFDPEKINLKVGLEIHQQLATSTKLFCACPIAKSDELPYSFERRLRPAQSETGRVDPAAVFEFLKGKSNVYAWSPESSCLVEADEEPPHPLNAEAVDGCVLIASLLGSSVLDEVHVMRKIVIDGSNTSGFQRTAIIALGGALTARGMKIGVQTVTVEEDAARILDEDARSRRFGLDRLGVPLVEIALDPVTATPDAISDVALHLGRVLRSTGRAARGLGTIRQDLNVSVMGGKVVEVKGVQKLNLLPKVVAYEAARQMGLIKVAEEIVKRKIKDARCRHSDVSSQFSATGSKVIHRQMRDDGKVVCITVAGLRGLLGWEPYPGVRLGRELAEVARVNSLGGVIHSDEFAKQGIGAEEEGALRREVDASKDDGLVLVAGEPERVDTTVELIEERLRQAPAGVPAETRAATNDGETRFLRPRPGAQRMYPETDIPVMVVTLDRLRRVAELAPEPWDAKVKRYEKDYSLSGEMALKLYDSDRAPLFENLSRRLRLEPSLIASILLDVPVRLAREGVNEEKMTDQVLSDVLDAIAGGKLAKEAATDVLRIVGKGQSEDVTTAVAKLGLVPMTQEELLSLIDRVIQEEKKLVSERGEAAFSPLMGEVMKRARGRADGGLVGRLLKERLSGAA